MRTRRREPLGERKAAAALRLTAQSQCTHDQSSVDLARVARAIDHIYGFREFVSLRPRDTTVTHRHCSELGVIPHTSMIMNIDRFAFYGTGTITIVICK